MALMTIWGDESSQNGHRYMVLGTIWENPAYAADIERDVGRLKQEVGFNKNFHWTEMKGHHRKAYKGLVDIFESYMRQGVIKFRALVVDMSNKKNKKEGDDDELHFYKMFFWLIYKRLTPQDQYDIYLHRKSNSVPGRLSDLEYFLNRRIINDYINKSLSMVQPGKPLIVRGIPLSVVRRVEPRDGSQVQLQLADVFAGAIAYVRNGYYKVAKANNSKNAKVDLVDHIEKRIGVSLTACHSKTESDGFNIWCFERK